MSRNPSDPKLAALKATSFQGMTLRGLLLEAYAFSKIGQITAPEKRMMVSKPLPAS